MSYWSTKGTRRKAKHRRTPSLEAISTFVNEPHDDGINLEGESPNAEDTDEDDLEDAQVVPLPTTSRSQHKSSSARNEI